MIKFIVILLAFGLIWGLLKNTFTFIIAAPGKFCLLLGIAAFTIWALL